jgi:DNA-binding CsgD family transcriptional regulator
MTGTTDLRPVERCIRRLVDDGVSEADIATRFRRSPEYVRRVLALSALPDRHASEMRSTSRLRPLERRVLRWRDEGADPSDFAPRFRRSPEHLERVEQLARYKLAR